MNKHAWLVIAIVVLVLAPACKKKTPPQPTAPSAPAANIIDIAFGTEATQANHLLSGWSGNELLAAQNTRFNWALGPSAALKLKLPSGACLLTATMKTFTFPEPQVVTVRLDGRDAAVWTLPANGAWQTRAVEIPAAAARPALSTISFHFSRYLDTAGTDKRPLAVMFTSLQIIHGAADGSYPGNPIQAGQIQFGTEETATRHLLSGWAANETTADKKYRFNWALGSSAALQLGLPVKEPVYLNIRLIPFAFETPQVIQVSLDGQSLGEIHPENKWAMQLFSLEIPAAAKRPPVSRIEFKFAQYRASDSGAKDKRPLAAMFESIVLSPEPLPK